MNIKLRTSDNYEQSPEDHEHPYGVSETVPDQSMTVLELLDRHQRGLPIKQNLNGYYSEDDLINIKTLDLVEIQDMRENLASQTKHLRKQLSDEEQQLRDKKLLEKAISPPNTEGE